MILYTPMQLELVLAGIEQMDRPAERKVTINGIPALVQDTGGGKSGLVRLLSTDPADYLRKDLSPGTIVKID